MLYLPDVLLLSSNKLLDEDVLETSKLLEDTIIRVVYPITALVFVLVLLGCGSLSSLEQTQVVGSPTAVPLPTLLPVREATPAPPETGFKQGDKAFDFTLNDMSGNKVKLSDFRGQAVMLNFWATWCGFCRVEFPVIRAAYDTYRDQGFVVLAINVNEDQSVVEAFARDTNLTFPILLDTEAQVALQYRIRGLPTSLFIDRDGVISAVQIGPVDEEALTYYLTQLGVQ